MSLPDETSRNLHITVLRSTLLVALAALPYGCDADSNSSSSSASRSEQTEKTARTLEVQPWSAPSPTNLLDPPDATRRRLDLTEPEKFPPCRALFEPNGRLIESFLPEQRRPELAVAGCDPEAYRKLEAGGRLVAYRLGGEAERGVDLRLVVFDAEGDRSWSYRLDRSDYAGEFSANFRSSFIVPLLPRLVCVGTLWEGGTQVACLDADKHEAVWSGELEFWSAIPLQSQGTSLVGADISGITRRYPYSGVEMRRVDFEHTGGHGALYATDGRRLYFAPESEKPQRLTAYRFETFEPIWRAKLPAHPDPGYNQYAFDEHGVAAVKIDESIYGFDARTGEVRWGFRIGDDRPPVAAGPERLYVLVSRSDEASLLVAVDPESGAIDWHGRVPTGTLSVQWTSGMLLIRSVRAFQRVRNVN